MMTGAHSDVMLIEHLGHVMRMHAFEIEGQDPEPSLAGAEQAETRNLRQRVDTIAGEGLFMVEDVLAAQALDEIQGEAEADRAGDVRGPGLEAMRRLLIFGLLEAHMQDHLAAAL